MKWMENIGTIYKDMLIKTAPAPLVNYFWFISISISETNMATVLVVGNIPLTHPPQLTAPTVLS